MLLYHGKEDFEIEAAKGVDCVAAVERGEVGEGRGSGMKHWEHHQPPTLHKGIVVLVSLKLDAKLPAMI